MFKLNLTRETIMKNKLLSSESLFKDKLRSKHPIIDVLLAEVQNTHDENTEDSLIHDADDTKKAPYVKTPYVKTPYVKTPYVRRAFCEEDKENSISEKRAFTKS